MHTAGSCELLRNSIAISFSAMTTSYESVPIIFLAVETSWVWPVRGVITLNPFCSLSFPCQPWTSAYVPRQREGGWHIQLRLAPHRCSGTWPPSPRSCSAPTGRSAPRTWLLWLWRCCCLWWMWWRWWLLRSSQLTVAAQHQPSTSPGHAQRTDFPPHQYWHFHVHQSAHSHRCYPMNGYESKMRAKCGFGLSCSYIKILSKSINVGLCYYLWQNLVNHVC